MIETTLGIEGMMCSMCEAHVSDTIRRSFAVKSAKSDRRRGQCVIVSEEPLDEERLRSVVAGTGYELRSISMRIYQRRSLFGRFR